MNKLTRIFAASSLLAATAGLTACTDADTAMRTLQKAGYTDVQTTGYKMLSCSDDDTFSTGFTAKNPRGEQVDGVVCSSYFVKSATIRF